MFIPICERIGPLTTEIIASEVVLFGVLLAVLGVAFFVMTGGNWGHVARRCFESGARLLPYCAVLFIPIAILVPSLYPWAGPDNATLGHVKGVYLSQGFFIVILLSMLLVESSCSVVGQKIRGNSRRGLQRACNTWLAVAAGVCILGDRRGGRSFGACLPQLAAKNGLPSDAGALSLIVFGLREMSTSTTIVAI